MLKRKAYHKLLEWKKEEQKKALCIVGARQIGKTTLVREFGKENYNQFVEINFLTDENFVIQRGMSVDLIEIKSGNDYKKHNALNNISAMVYDYVL